MVHDTLLRSAACHANGNLQKLPGCELCATLGMQLLAINSGLMGTMISKLQGH